MRDRRRPPGETVEASSPCSSKARTKRHHRRAGAATRITNLLPGVYVVNFTMAGFSTVQREDVQLTSNFTANINAEMQVGQLEETVTVSGQSPVVDIQNVVQQKVISREMLFALPINKELGGYAAITPGAIVAPTQQDVGGNKDPISQYITIHGSRTTDSRVLLDGMRFNAEGQGRGFYFNPAAAQEVSVELGGQTAEFEAGGVQVNMVPKEGGNLFSGFFVGNYTNSHLSSDNLNDDLRARGLTVVNTTDLIYEANGALGGPFARTSCGSSPPTATGATATSSPATSTTDDQPAAYTADTDAAGVHRRTEQDAQSALHVAGVTAPQGEPVLRHSGHLSLPRRAHLARGA